MVYVLYTCVRGERDSGKITQLAAVPKASYIMSSQFHYSPVTRIGPDGIEKKKTVRDI